ncbi:MAG: uridine kinase [Pseudomonadota bacterium]
MTQPLIVVGIAGGTGSGKTTVARKIAAALPVGAAEILEYDSYYKGREDVPMVNRADLNYDHPDSLDADLLVEHLTALRAGLEIEVPVYDFMTHSRLKETRHVEPTSVIIVEGILVFVSEQLRNLLDIKIYVDTSADIRIMRRVRRDIEERGREFSTIREQYYKTVRPMHLQFVEPSKRWADLVIPEGGENEVALDTIVGKLLHVLSG